MVVMQYIPNINSLKDVPKRNYWLIKYPKISRYHMFQKGMQGLRYVSKKNNGLTDFCKLINDFTDIPNEMNSLTDVLKGIKSQKCSKGSIGS